MACHPYASADCLTYLGKVWEVGLVTWCTQQVPDEVAGDLVVFAAFPGTVTVLLRVVPPMVVV